MNLSTSIHLTDVPPIDGWDEMLTDAWSNKKSKEIWGEPVTENTRIFLIEPLCEYTKQLYSDHGTYHPGDAGIDLFIPLDITIPANGIKRVNMGVRIVSVSSNRNHSWYIVSRSSLPSHGLVFANAIGVMDKSYSGEVIVQLKNVTDTTINVLKGVRLVQIINSNGDDALMKVINKEEMEKRIGNRGGLGSTGL